jgi:hypothetical protein
MPGSLRDQLADQATLLIFLRHFGCIFCRETVGDLRALSEKDPSFPSVLFFSQGSPTEARVFLNRYWSSGRSISDPELGFYEAFGVHQGSFLQTIGPGVLLSTRRAAAKGYENGPRDGDIWRMPGAFLVRGGDILWRHEFRHAADYPDFDQVPRFSATAS